MYVLNPEDRKNWHTYRRYFTLMDTPVRLVRRILLKTPLNRSKDEDSGDMTDNEGLRSSACLMSKGYMRKLNKHVSSWEYRRSSKLGHWCCVRGPLQ